MPPPGSSAAPGCVAAVRKRNEKQWEERQRRKRRRMMLHGRTLGKVYKDAVTKRTPVRKKGVTHGQDEDRKPTERARPDGH